MKYQEAFTRIEEKLALLHSLDPNLQLFGAAKHEYTFYEPMTEAEMAGFEKDFGVQLPPDYRAFLTTVGNGGPGPFYGLEHLGAALLVDIEYPEDGHLDPSVPFPHTEPFNPVEGVGENGQPRTKEEYNASHWCNGLVRLANYGCGITVNLVVNGPDYGKTWVDERINENGFYHDHLLGNQGRLSFLEWYELWLDQSLAEVGHVVGGRASE